jgi:hypothetical protein
VFVLVKSLFWLAQGRGLNPPLDPQAAGLGIEGRAVPDYGSPFNFLFGGGGVLGFASSGGAGILPAVFGFDNETGSRLDAGATKTSTSGCKTIE